MTIHDTAIQKIASKLQENIAKNNLPFLTWHCEHCHDEHNFRLSNQIAKVKTEYTVKASNKNPRTDIALLDSTDRIISCIEVVDTHRPDKETRNAYVELNILVFEIFIKSRKELSKFLDNEIPYSFISSSPNIPLIEGRDFIGIEPSKLCSNQSWFIKTEKTDLCFMPKCSCGNRYQKREIFVQGSSCWKCNASIILASKGLSGPKTFTQEEKEYAIAQGACLEERYSKAADEKYLGNVCSCCGILQGDFFLHEAIDVYSAMSKVIMMECKECTKIRKSTKLEAPI